MSETRNVIIIGSGPAGYTAAVYAARASLKPLMFEGSVTAGGALMTTTEVENFPGFRDGIMGPALMDEMRAQSERFGAELVADDVVEVDLTGDVKVVKTATDTYTARAVILAMGSGYRKLGLPNELELSGRGVSWCATCDGFFFRDAAHRRGRRWRLGDRGGDVPHPLRVQGVADPPPRRAARLQDHAGARVRRSQARDRLELRGGRDQRRRVAREHHPARHRHRRRPATSRRPGCSSPSATTRARSCCPARSTSTTTATCWCKHPSTHTNLTGVFAAGDLVDHHYRQAVTAAGTGCAAALDAERYLALLDHHGSSAGSMADTEAEVSTPVA